MKTTTRPVNTAIVDGTQASPASPPGIGRNKLMSAALIAACGFCATYSAATTAADAYLRTTTDSIDLTADGTPIIITKVSVPAGTWIVTAKANPVNFGDADYVRCRILVGSVQKDAGATLVGNANPGLTGELGPSVAEIMLQTAIITTTTKTFKLDCLHDNAQTGEYVDPGASIMVVRAPGPLG